MVLLALIQKWRDHIDYCRVAVERPGVPKGRLANYRSCMDHQALALAWGFNSVLVRMMPANV